MDGSLGHWTNLDSERVRPAERRRHARSRSQGTASAAVTGAPPAQPPLRSHGNRRFTERAFRSTSNHPMTCCHYALVEGNESAFAVDPSTIAFGAGVLAEAGEHLRALSCRRVALFTDATLARLEPVADGAALPARRGARRRGVRRRARRADRRLVPRSRRVREGRRVRRLRLGRRRLGHRHAARPPSSTRRTRRTLRDLRQRADRRGQARARAVCRRTSPVRRRAGTGSECTGIAVFDDLSLQGEDRHRLAAPAADARARRPDVHAHAARPMVVAASGFDVLCHALESYTARPFTARARPRQAVGRGR